MLKKFKPSRNLLGSRPWLKLFSCVLIAFLVLPFGLALVKNIYSTKVEKSHFTKVAARYDLEALSRPIKPVEGVLIEVGPHELLDRTLDEYDFRQMSLFGLLSMQSHRHRLFSAFAERWTYEGDPEDHPTLHGLFGETFRKRRLGLNQKSFRIDGPSRFWVNHPSHTTIEVTCEVTVTRSTFEFPEARLIERWPLLERRFERLFRAARSYEDAVFNFLVHAANEIKEHDCGPDTEKIVEKWQRKAIEFRIDTYNGRVFGAELRLFYKYLD